MSDVIVDAAGTHLDGFLDVPAHARGLVVFAHGSGSTRFSNRDRYVADELNLNGYATLLFDLLTVEEYREDTETGLIRHNVGLLADRLTGAVDWAGTQTSLKSLPVGLFGSDTGAAAALATAAERAANVQAIVSQGGRPDLAGNALPWVKAPTLLIVGGHDVRGLEVNRHAATFLRGENRIALVPGAGHTFDEPGALQSVAELARDWYHDWLRAR
ncbi:MAG: dienelactone hydrolase family protein [Gammaproteobacteria bacterium]|nr:dienelactone hydrolase family protein [Gammaproteobacteria bacterium]